MPAAAVVAGVAQLGGAFLQHRSQSSANKAQQRATDQAIALEREREKAKALRYEQAMEDYRRQYDAWYEGKRQTYAKYYGIDLPAATPYDRMSSGSGHRQAAPGGAPAASGIPAVPLGGGAPVGAKPLGLPKELQGLTLGDMAGGGGPQMFDSQGGPVSSNEAPQGMTLGDMTDWTDWRKHAAG